MADDGFYRPKYRDKKTGKTRTAKVWWVRSDPVSGKRASTGARSKEGAVAWRQERERRAANPYYAASHEATIGEWVTKVLETKRQRRAEGTADMYRVKLGHVARILGSEMPMASITPDRVDHFVATRQAEGATNNTIGKELTAILQLCKHARRAGQYSGDVSALRPVGFSINYEPRRGHLKREWLPMLERALAPHQIAAVKAIVATGARRSEYYELRAEDCDTTRWLVQLRGTKTEKARRVVPIPTPFRALLRAALTSLEPKWDRITHDLPRVCEDLGLPKLTPNDLRRTHSTWLIEAGVSKELIADSLGHADSRMVERVYGAAAAEAVLEVMERQIGRKTSKSRRRKRQAKSKTKREAS
jgi:integrase